MSKIIGIDLGTTNSCVAVIEGGEPIIIPNAEGTRTTPSVVSFTKDDEQSAGLLARNQLVTNPTRTIISVKRDMGTDRKFDINGKKYTPQEISSLILAKLKNDAESYLGATVTDAVITVPAYFTDAQKQATKDAGEIAGLCVKRIIAEPTAAALSYGLDKEQEQNIIVYDLGGGTFDVSIIEIGNGIQKVLATGGNNRLGGDDFDMRIVDFLVDEFNKSNGVDLSDDKLAMRRIRDEAEKAKINLSGLTKVSVNIPFITASANMEVEISQAKFNELIADLVEKTIKILEQSLEDSGLSKEKIDKLLLVGGSTRIPIVYEAVKNFISKEPFKGINPDECVAMGAVIQGGILTGEMGGEMLLLDVTPFDLGVETCGGIFTVMIERNTTIPTKISKVYSTAADNQPSVDIRVFQGKGESQFTENNTLIGNFCLDGIAPASKAVPRIEVSFDIDVNGIINVSAKDLDTGKQQNVTITESNNMSDKDINKAKEKAALFAMEDRARRT